LNRTTGTVPLGPTCSRSRTPQPPSIPRTGLAHFGHQKPLPLTLLAPGASPLATHSSEPLPRTQFAHIWQRLTILSLPLRRRSIPRPSLATADHSPQTNASVPPPAVASPTQGPAVSSHPLFPCPMPSPGAPGARSAITSAPRPSVHHRCLCHRGSPTSGDRFGSTPSRAGSMGRLSRGTPGLGQPMRPTVALWHAMCSGPSHPVGHARVPDSARWPVNHFPISVFV
jgi:hypothetical protein